MKTLFVDRKGAALEIEGSRLLVRITGRERHYSTPLGLLEFLVISASVSLSSGLLTRLSMEGVTTVMLNPRRAEATCIAHGLLHNAADRRLLQYQAIADPALRLEYARTLVRQKIRGQCALLGKALRKRPDKRHSLTKGIKRLNGLEAAVNDATGSDSLRGIEGAAAAFYFAAFQAIFPPRLHFRGRNRRPPRDPVNAVLSLSYTLLHAEAIRALIARGFDPQLGVYHLPVFGRESLACDLMEVFRPLVDYWVWRLFTEEVLLPEHFAFEPGAGGPCMLGKAGRSLYYAHYEGRALGWRKLMRKATGQWLARLDWDLGQRTGQIHADKVEVEEPAAILGEGR